VDNNKWTMSHIFFVAGAGVDLEFEDCTETLGMETNGIFYQIDALETLRRAAQLNILSIRSISAEDIRKRAKTSYLIKALVCLQPSWLVAQVIGRAIVELPITTLEVVTVGYVVCALITYFCWWQKPQDAELSITVNCKNLTKANFQEQVKAFGAADRYVVGWWETPLICLVCATFGAVHCMAWNFSFLTSVENLTWRAASVLTVVIPGFLASCIDDRTPTWVAAFSGFLAFAYVPVRLFLMIEPFAASGPSQLAFSTP
jgi:hypothetical protein